MWGEPYLSGQRGGQLEIRTSKASRSPSWPPDPPRRAAACIPPSTANSRRRYRIYCKEVPGSAGGDCVLEAKTGRVLALATYPNFDPSLFANGISDQQWQILQADGRRPLVNRATQGTYASGSVFKIVTMGTAMEKAGLTRASTFTCQGIWTASGAELAQDLLGTSRTRSDPPGQSPDRVVRHHLLPGRAPTQRDMTRICCPTMPTVTAWASPPASK